MRKCVLAACLVFCSSMGMLKGQTPVLPPDGMVGVPYSYDFAQLIDPFLSEIPPEIGFSFSFTVSDGSLPPGLTIASNTISGTPTQAGFFTVNVGFSETITVDGMTQTFGPFPFPITINITGNSGGAVAANPASLTFSLTQGSTSVVSQSVVISNTSATAATFTVNAATNSGGNWLSVTPAIRNCRSLHHYFPFCERRPQ